MKPLTLTLFLGLISSLGFSQIGVYSPMDYYNMYTSIRNPKNGNILAWGYDDNNDYRLVEVSGNGVLKHVTSAPQYPAFPDEIGEFFLGNYAEIRTLDSGFVIYGTLFQRNEENRKIYVSAYFEFFNWHYEQTHRFESGIENPMEVKHGISYSDSTVSFFSIPYDLIDSTQTYKINQDYLYWCTYNFKNEFFTKDTIIPDVPWDYFSFIHGNFIGDALYNFVDPNHTEPDKNWIFDIKEKKLSRIDFPFSPYGWNLNYPLAAYNTVNPNNGSEIMAVSFSPLRYGDYPDYEMGENFGLFYYFLNKNFEITKHYYVADIEYPFYPSIGNSKYGGAQETLYGDTIEMAHAFNKITDSEGNDSISPYTGEPYEDGFLYLKMVAATGEVLDRRFISRIAVTGENFNPSAFGHDSQIFYFNTNRDSVTMYTHTNKNIDVHEQAFITVAIKDMPLSTANGLTKTQLKIYPNPTTDQLRFESMRPGTYTIINTSGQVMSKGNYNGTTVLNVREFPQGGYVIQVQEKNKVAQAYPFLKK